MFSDFISASGHSQRYWAARLGVSPCYLSQLRGGKKLPSLALAVVIERETGGAVPASSWLSVPAAPSGEDAA